VRSITLIIRWHEHEPVTELILHEEDSGVSLPAKELTHSNSKHLPPVTTRKAEKQLLPSDRVILDALRRRVSQGKQITTPVRNGELMEECSISRRQVQICLKRLTGKGLIKRLTNETEVGTNAGYRYFIT
jgi:hypothetical protein